MTKGNLEHGRKVAAKESERSKFVKYSGGKAEQKYQLICHFKGTKYDYLSYIYDYL